MKAVVIVNLIAWLLLLFAILLIILNHNEVGLIIGGIALGGMFVADILWLCEEYK